MINKELTNDLFLLKKEIDSAVSGRRFVLIKHHNDLDGYAAGIILESLIKNRIKESHPLAKPWFLLKRIPMKSPVYEIGDANKDINLFLSQDRLPPLNPTVLIADNGGTYQDIEGISHLKTFGFKVLVVDHHPLGELPKNITKEDFLKNGAHILVNPKVHDENDTSMCTGMLALDCLKNEERDLGTVLLAYLSSLTDKIDSDEQKELLKILKENNFEEEHLSKLASSLAVMIQNNFGDCAMQIKKIISSSIAKQKEFIDLYYHKIEEERKKIKERVLAHNPHENIFESEDKILYIININQFTARGGFFNPGKVVGIMQEHYESKENIFLGFGEGSLTVRSNSKNFSLHELLEHLAKRFPHADVSGGGHDVAGSLRFLTFQEDEIKQECIHYCKKVLGL